MHNIRFKIAVGNLIRVTLSRPSELKHEVANNHSVT